MISSCPLTLRNAAPVVALHAIGEFSLEARRLRTSVVYLLMLLLIHFRVEMVHRVLVNREFGAVVAPRPIIVAAGSDLFPVGLFDLQAANQSDNDGHRGNYRYRQSSHGTLRVAERAPHDIPIVFVAGR